MFAAARVGMNLTAASPPGFEVKPEVVGQAREMAAETGASVGISNDTAQATHAADVVYTDVWASMGQETEAAARQEKFRGFQVNEELMKHANPDAVILHCLPAHYDEEIDYATSRTPNSAIFDQAENRMHAQNALMVLLAG